MREEIEKLIAGGNTEEALDKLAQINNDGILLMGRYNNGKRQYLNGMISFTEWSRLQSQLNFAALDLVKNMKSATTAPAQQTPPTPAAANNGNQATSTQKVFISYNHNDHIYMRSIKGELEKEGIHVLVDISDMQAAEDIRTFIYSAFKNSDIIISVISKNSLLSGWVGVEMQLARTSNILNANWIPVAIDDSWRSDDFLKDGIKQLHDKVQVQRKKLREALDSGQKSTPYTRELERLEEVSSNFESTVADLKDKLIVDLSGSQFDIGIKRVISTIQAKLNL